MIKKICSILLVVCLVVCLVPEAVFGASKITRLDGSALDKVYVGSKYTLVVKDKQVKFSSANSKIATFTKTGKLKPLAAGRVKITAKNFYTGKAVASKVVTVLKRSEKVKADTKEIYLNKGETQKIKATLVPADSSDYIYFKSSNKEVAKVDSETGEITAIKNGEATITLYAKATKATKNSSENNRTTTVKVYVGPIMKEAKQLSVTVVELNFMTNMENYRLKPSDFTIKCTETSGIFSVRAVSVSGKTVKLTTYGEIKDGKVYRVSYDTTSANFTATDAKVKTMRIEPTVIDVKTLTEIKLVLLDNDGVIVGSYNQNNKLPNVDFNIDTTDGFVSGGKLYLNTVNSKAIAKAVYHTYIYKKDEKTGNMVEAGLLSTGDVTISAVEPKEDEEEPDPTPTPPIYIDPYSVQVTTAQIYRPVKVDSNAGQPTEDNTDTEEEIEKPKEELVVKLGTLVPDFDTPTDLIYYDNNAAGPSSVPVYFRIIRYGTEVADYSAYTVSLSNETKGNAEISSDTSSDASQDQATEAQSSDQVKIHTDADGRHYINVTPKDIGTRSSASVQLIIKDQYGSTIKTKTLTINTVEPRYNYLLLATDKTTITKDNPLSVTNVHNYNYYGESLPTTADVAITLRDQYGQPLTSDELITLSLSDSRGSTASEGPIASTELSECALPNGRIISVDAGRSISDGYIKAGDYDYTIRYSFGSKDPLVGGSFKINVTKHHVEPKLVLEKNQEFKISRVDDGVYDFKALLNAAYRKNGILYGVSDQDIKIVSVKASISGDKNSIIFEQAKFEIKVKDLGKDAYILYTYNFKSDDAKVSIDPAISTDPSEPSGGTEEETSN